MTLQSLTFSGSYLELAGWIFVGCVYLALAFTAGWFCRWWKQESK